MSSDVLDRRARVYVAGHRGLVGRAIWRHLEHSGFRHLHGLSSAELDLREQAPVRAYFEHIRPQYVVMAAARVGGIQANIDSPATFLADNLAIQLNILEAAREVGVSRLLFLGSNCIYPRSASQPIRESALLGGPLEPTNEAYAIAKIAGLLHVQALRRQWNVRFVSVMPPNLYGPYDNFDLRTSHVLPAMIARLHDAKVRDLPVVTCWGSGTPRREFLHVDDLARACLLVLERYDHDSPINVGTGQDHSIAELARLVADVVGYSGAIAWDPSKPDGTPRKVLDVSRITDLGWRPQFSLREGIRKTYEWYVTQQTPELTPLDR